LSIIVELRNNISLPISYSPQQTGLVCYSLFVLKSKFSVLKVLFPKLSKNDISHDLTPLRRIKQVCYGGT